MSNDHATSPGAGQRGAESAGEPIARRKLSHEVQERLLAALRAGEYPVGALMPSERELMARYAVGRPAVREAMQALQRMGLVDIVHGEGARVRALDAGTVIGQISDNAMHLLSGSPALLEELKEARLTFEVAMARRAAQHTRKADLSALRDALEAHRTAQGDPQAFLETDMAFHRAIAAVSGNSVFMAVSQAMLHWLQQFHGDLVRAPGVERTTFAEHEQLFERIAAKDPDGAAAIVTAHLTRAHRHYRNPGTAAAAKPRKATRKTP